MARKPSGKPNGRPPIEINFETFEQLCGLHCTSEEIASFMKIHVETLRLKVEEHYGESFPAIYKRFVEQGKCSLRRDQRVMAKKSASMGIWLGKQYLGQKDVYLEQNISETTIHQFNALMKQLTQLQGTSEAPPSDLKSADTSNNAATKS